MKNLHKYLFILILVPILCCTVGCKENANINPTNSSNNPFKTDIGISYYSGNSKETSFVFDLESASWQKGHKIKETNPMIEHWEFCIKYKITNNTTENFYTSANDFFLFYKTPSTSLEINNVYLFPLNMDSPLQFLPSGQSAYLYIFSKSFNFNPSTYYNECFYLIHKDQTNINSIEKHLCLGIIPPI